MRNHRSRQEFEIRVFRQVETLRLSREVLFQPMDLRRGLSSDVGHSVLADRYGNVEAVPLQHAAGRGDDVHARQSGQVLVPVQRLLCEQGRLPVQVLVTLASSKDTLNRSVVLHPAKWKSRRV